LFKTILAAKNRTGIGPLEYAGAGYLYKGAGGITKYVSQQDIIKLTDEINKIKI
jgi:hypothetical protein